MCLSKESIQHTVWNFYPKSLSHQVGNGGFRMQRCGPHGSKSVALVFFRTAASKGGSLCLKKVVMAFLLITRRLACSSQKNLHLFTPGKPHQNPSMTCSLRDTGKQGGLWSESSRIEGAACFLPSFFRETISTTAQTLSIDGHFSCRKEVGAAQSHSAQEG